MQPEPGIRLLLIDDHAVARNGVRLTLGSGLRGFKDSLEGKDADARVANVAGAVYTQIPLPMQVSRLAVTVKAGPLTGQRPAWAARPG